MSPQAKEIKRKTLEKYEYCVEDRVKGFEEKLRQAENQPDEFWEKLALSQRG
jgi:hypothetical protein